MAGKRLLGCDFHILAISQLEFKVFNSIVHSHFISRDYLVGFPYNSGQSLQHRNGAMALQTRAYLIDRQEQCAFLAILVNRPSTALAKAHCICSASSSNTMVKDWQG
jgi:hypothetical protein